MGGRITVISAPGEGTRVHLDLPVKPADVPALPEKEPLRPAVSETSLNILVADDLSANRLVLKGQLELLGHRVTAVDSGEAAFAAWREGDFDALITDCNMPGMDGYELTRAIRSLEQRYRGRERPIIGCTANAMHEERDRCEAAGMDALLVKPVSLAQLAQKLEDVVMPAEKEQRAFDIQVLHHMTQANEVQIQRMLAELWKNLRQEHDLLVPAVATYDWKALSISLHRLKGVACLIDAVPLAKACAQMDSEVREQRSARIEASWQVLNACMDALLDALEDHLVDVPAL
jgi:two-component system sensor histidine kinase EvgS